MKHSVGSLHLFRCEVTRPLCDSMLCVQSSSIFLEEEKKNAIRVSMQAIGEEKKGKHIL